MEVLFVILLVFVIAGAILFWNVREKTPDSSLKVSTQPPPPPSRTEPQVATQTLQGVPTLLDLLPEQFIVLDLETTGLDPNEDEIIEFGAIRVNLVSDTLDTFQGLVKPDRKIPRNITQITGITQEMVDKDGGPLRPIFLKFMEFIGDLPPVTFNAQFDMAFLSNTAYRYNLFIKNDYSCALKLARRAWPGLSSYRLVDLSKMAKLSLEDSQRALADCRRTVIVYTSAVSTLGKSQRKKTKTKKKAVSV